MRLKRLMYLVVLFTIVITLVLWEHKKEVVETRPIPRPVVERSDTVIVKQLYKAPANSAENKWKLFLGINHSMDDLKDIQSKVFQVNEYKMDAHEQYLKSIDSDFRESISRSVPIHCYSGEYGLFPKKYRKFIDLLVEYSHFHNHQPTTRVLVWECLRTGTCGGIALGLAMLSGRKLFIDWKADNLLQYLEPNVINCIVRSGRTQHI